MHTKLFKLSFYVLIFLLISCSNDVKMYMGPELDPSEESMLRIKPFFIDCTIISIDNYSMKDYTFPPGGTDFRLMPGEHTIILDIGKFIFKTSPGHSYSFQCSPIEVKFYDIYCYNCSMEATFLSNR